MQKFDVLDKTISRSELTAKSQCFSSHKKKHHLNWCLNGATLCFRAPKIKRGSRATPGRNTPDFCFLSKTQLHLSTTHSVMIREVCLEEDGCPVPPTPGDGALCTRAITSACMRLLSGTWQLEGDPGLNCSSRLSRQKPEPVPSSQEVALFTAYIRKEICLDFNLNAEISPFCKFRSKFKASFVNSGRLFSQYQILVCSHAAQPGFSLPDTPAPLLIISALFVNAIHLSLSLFPLFSFIPYSVHFQTAVAISSLLLTVSIWLLSPHASCSLGNSPCCPLPLTISFAALAGMARALQTTGGIMRQDEHVLPRYPHSPVPTA